METNIPARVRELCLRPEARVYDALKILDNTHREIVLVVSDEGQLLGTVTDGDIRRAMLDGLSTDIGVIDVMNKGPVVARHGMSERGISQLMKRHRVMQMPLVNGAGRVVDLVLFSEMIQEDTPAKKAVIMAGGQGSRLRPLTSDLPKPLLPVGDKPILEIIVEQLVDCGMVDIYLMTHYKAEMIEDHFSRLHYPSCDLHFIAESEPMGTAGGLRLLLDCLDGPFLVMNADIISRMSFKDMLRCHIDAGAAMTVATKIQDLEIPYGVIEVGEGGRIESVTEKPIMHFTFNIGVYGMSPSVLDSIPDDEVMDMPGLIRELIARGEFVNEYAVSDYWIDIGRMADYERACEDIVAKRL